MAKLELGKIGQIAKFAQDDFIVSEGQSGDCMYIILDGAAHVYISSYMDAPIKVHELEKGDFFGEMALLENEPRSASIIAIQDTTTIKIDQSNFESLLENHPDIAMRMLRSLSRRLRKTNAELSALRTQKNQSHSTSANTPTTTQSPNTSTQPIKSSAKTAYEDHAHPTSKADSMGNKKSTSEGSINVLAILPKKHNLYKFDLYTEQYEKIVLHKDITCPICGMPFKADLIRNSKLQIKKEGKFFRKFYKFSNPLANHIWTCPNCLYSKTFYNFHSIPVFKKEPIEELLLNLKCTNKFNNNNLDDINAIFIKYFLAIYIEENTPKPSTINLAKYWLNLYWLYSDVKDAKMTEIALDNTHKYYKEAYYASRLNLSEIEELRLGILVAELCFAKDEKKEAYNLLSRIIVGKKIPTALKQKASDLMYEAKSSLKSIPKND